MNALPAPPEVLPHRPPFLFIDEVTHCEDTWAHARRLFRADEPYFAGHFPGRPIVPGVLLLEGMAQTFAYLALRDHPNKGVYLTGVERARFRKPVTPGQTVEFRVKVEEVRMGVIWGRAEAVVDGTKVASARISGVVGDIPEE